MDERQKKSLSMYKDVVRILEDNGIRYYAACGTLIGAVRHSGFIPWDWDMDIYVFAEDLERINSVLSGSLDSERYYYHIPSADTHPHVFFKDDDFETDLREHRAIYMDIFVLYDYPSAFLRRMIVRSMIFMYSWMTAVVIDRVANVTVHRVLSAVPAICRHIAGMVTDTGCHQCIPYTTNYYLNIFEKGCFEEAVMHEFEDISVPIPNGWDLVLRTRYGDYMTPPPPDERESTGYPASAYFDYING